MSTVLIVPGWRNSGPGHWQTLWAEQLPCAQRVVQDDWLWPRREAWVQRLADTIEAQREPVVLAAHSLGCITVAHLPAALAPRIAGALLVAPADPERRGPLADFAPVPHHRLPWPSVLVASDNDPFCPVRLAGAYARAWGSEFIRIDGAGHINVASGHGEWPLGRELLRRLRTRTDARTTLLSTTPMTTLTSALPAAPGARRATRRVLPGFHLTLGYTLFYLGLIVLIPLSALVFKTLSMTWPQFWEAVASPRVLASYRLTFGASLIAASVNVVFGLLVAWVLVRYSFPGKKIVDALVDLPFALPTAVAGISLTALLADNGWVGQWFAPLGIQLAFNPNGVVIALIFIGLPFVVRTVQPVLEDTEKELEEAASSLGATRWQIFWRVIFPSIAPALLTGFAMAFARAVGEYGSVIFIAGNMPMVSEITPLIIIAKLEQYDYAGATAVASVMLAISFVLLLIINGLQSWQRKRSGGAMA